MTAVVALGGNALMRPGERGTAARSEADLSRALDVLANLLNSGHLHIPGIA